MALFRSEGPKLYGKALKHNQPWATHQAPWKTNLTPAEGKRFREWLEKHDVPFDPRAKRSDYDMRGYWKKYHGTPEANHQPGEHFPDEYKTPYDTSFSAESKYAKPGTPFVWRGDKLVNRKNGRVIYAPPTTASSSSTKTERKPMKMKYGGPTGGRPMLAKGRISKGRKAKKIKSMIPGSEGRQYLAKLGAVSSSPQIQLAGLQQQFGSRAPGSRRAGAPKEDLQKRLQGL